MTNTSQWVAIPVPRPNALIRLFCFPHAGGNANLFRSWAALLPERVETCLVQLPGRGTRLHEPQFIRLAHLIESLRAGLAGCLDKPVILFGHSMGALLCFELARSLRLHAQPLPIMIGVSGRRAPQLSPNRPPIHNLPDKELLSRLSALNGTPDAILRDEDLLKVLLPTIRADLEIVETYGYLDQAPFKCKIVAFAGAHDPRVPLEDIAAWQQQTSGPFSLEVFPGDHFFVYKTYHAVTNVLTKHLETCLTFI